MRQIRLQTKTGSAEAHRLAEAFPDGRLVELPDCYTLNPEDQPIALAKAIREFVGERSAEPSKAVPRNRLAPADGG